MKMDCKLLNKLDHLFRVLAFSLGIGLCFYSIGDLVSKETVCCVGGKVNH